jgi:3-hydroxyisobutyrate dehydrogenase-like beta-hydroxyacid dehydrogenase
MKLTLSLRLAAMMDDLGWANRIAVIGTGAIGGAVTGRLRACGRDVVVWNRTSGRASALAAAGAVPVASAAEAAARGRLILLTLTDYAAVRQCLNALGTDLSGRTVIAMSTGSPSDARLAAGQAEGLGAEYLDAGLQASPETIEAGTATILYGGSRTAFARHRADLELLGTARFVGDTPEASAVWVLALYGVWYDAQLGLLRALDAVQDAGVDVPAFAATAATQLGHVVDAAPATASELGQAPYPAGPATLTEHLAVVGQLRELRAGRPLGDGGLTEVSAAIEALVARGRGGEGLTAVVERLPDGPTEPA